MAQGYVVPLPQRIFDTNGDPAAGWLVRTTLAGVSTPVITYSNAGLTSANTDPIVTNASGYYTAGAGIGGMFVAEALIIDIDVYNAADVFQFSFDSIEAMPSPGFDASDSYNRSGATDSNGTYASATFTSPVVTGDAGTGTIFCKQALFTENATSTLHTATFVIPAGATLLDILVVPEVLWGAASAGLVVGDANAANGWFTSTDLKATDLVLGERLQASNANNWGGKNGAYLTTAGRFGQQSTTMIGGYCPTAYSVIGVVAVGTPGSTAGRTRMHVLWMVGQSVTPVTP